MPGCGREENQRQVFHRRPTSPWKSLARFPHSRSPGHYRVEKWKSKPRIPPFPRSALTSLSKPQYQNRKEPQPHLLTSSFRLISELEKTPGLSGG